jgi:hypothetical protein
LEIVRCEVLQDTVIGRNDCLGQAALVILQLQNLFLDGVAGDQAVSEYVALLTDAMLCARLTAWASTAEFHHGSRIKT